MLSNPLRLLFVLALAADIVAASAPPNRGVSSDLSWLDQYNVAWTGPSRDSADSMPCGGGDIGLNVWIEGGDLLFYADRSGNIDENDQQLKCGRFRIHLDSDPFADPARVRQELVLREGAVSIAGKGLRGRVWVEVHRPVIHVDLETTEAGKVLVSYESWRTKTQPVPLTLDKDGRPSGWDYHRWAMFGYFWYRGEVRNYADQIQFAGKNSVEFLHRNNNADLLFDKTVRLEGLEAAAKSLVSPTHNRIFGGRLTGDGLVDAGTSEGVYSGTPYTAWKLASASPGRVHHLRIFLHTEIAPSVKVWRADLERVIAGRTGRDSEAWKENQAWWASFWDRSHIVINSGRGPTDQPWRLGRNYQLFRYQLACNSSGEWPTRFNGGLFTFDPGLVDGASGDPSYFNPDFRAWGAWTGQNQRLVYWPLLRSGDFDAMLPEFDFYRKNLPNALARTRLSFGLEGASFGEQIGSDGLPLASHYGWPPPHGDRDPSTPVGLAKLHTYYYTTELEMAYMILEYHRYSGADISRYLPFVEESVGFFFNYYRQLQRQRTGQDWDADGKLVLEPAHALETYRGRNPTDVICGLKVDLEGLLGLPDAWVDQGRKALYRDWLSRLPDLNTRLADGRVTIAPVAGKAGPIGNYEIPQLYPVFPYGLYGLGLPDLQMARDTWYHGVDPCLGPEPWTKPRPGDKPWYPQRLFWYGWTQQAIWMARLGLTAEARDYIIKKLDDARGNNDFDSDKRRRFPSFWGPGFDWSPDHNWGGSGMIALQEMLLQTPGDRLLLLPTWPTAWDVDFKLHAPKGTVVECSYHGGKITASRVTPATRAGDLADWHARRESDEAPDPN